MEPQIDIVVARYKENLEWINDIDIDINVIIYNKGTAISESDFSRSVTILHVSNIGRESETYLRHIIKNYDTLADYTMFLQGDPFAHTNNFKHVLQNIKKFIKMYSEYHMIPFTNGWLAEKNIPPAAVYQNQKICLPMNLEEIFIDIQSTRTLQPLHYYDEGIQFFYKEYMKINNLPIGTNIMNHFFSQTGIHDLLPEKAETFYMFFAALFMVKKEQIRRHDLVVYHRMWHLCCTNISYVYIIERAWLSMFNGYDTLAKLVTTRPPTKKACPKPIEIEAPNLVEIEPVVEKPSSSLNRYLPFKFQLK